MNATATGDWLEANQRYLTAALAVVRETLAAHATRPNRPDTAGPAASAAALSLPEPVRQALRDAALALPAASALDTLCAAFGLSPFERDILLLCAGVEMDARFGPLCAAAHGDERRAYPTFGLALAALPGAHWSALIPARPLRQWRLIEVGGAEALVAGQLRIDERVLHYLAGVSYLDERLQSLVERVAPPADLPSSLRSLAREIAGLWTHFKDVPSWPAVQLCGAERTGKRAVAASACASLGVQVHAIRAVDLPSSPADRDGLIRLWQREAILSRTALLIDAEDLDGGDHMRSAVAFLESVRGMLVVTVREPLRLSRQTVRFDVMRPGATEQQALWQSALGSLAADLNGQIGAVATHFRLGIREIHAASAEILARSSQEKDAARGPIVWEACRAQARPHLADLAQRIEAVATWDDLVLPDSQRETLREIASHVRHRATVYDTWGFAARHTRGLGISAMFAGPSGTGKTLAAEVLAADLRLDLYRIDLSQVVSKYIGETEKNLRRVFDAAEDGGAILLFDEADALFGKRSEVKDSHDRYANIEISYLLQRMEAYRGLAILTTNMKGALDPAFLRRIRFIVHFPFPDAVQRAKIWQRVFPSGTPTVDLDVARLARLNVAGGNIRNIAMNAAFLAAGAAEPVRMEHLLQAARGEYAKLEKPLTEAEIGGWV